MIVVQMKPSDLLEYKNNARTHSADQINQIIKSIQEFGFNVPVEITTDNVILSGHARVQAAKQLGLEEIPVIIHTHLKAQNKQKAYTLAANKIAMNAEWDYSLLSEELGSLKLEDLELTGFSKLELDEIMGSVDFQPGELEDQGKLDELDPKLVTCPNCNTEFDTR